MIDKKQWESAQIAERKFHIMTEEEGREHFSIVYGHYFKYLKMSSNQNQKTILEIGPADFPALVYAFNYKHSYLIEPLPSENLKKLINDNTNITLWSKPAEEILLPEVDEVWIFNLLQHVVNPDAIIDEAKKKAKTIRFFEPINMPTDECHLHTFDLEYFIKHFGQNVVQHYKWQEGIIGFHTNDCAYGVWKKDNDLLNKVISRGAW